MHGAVRDTLAHCTSVAGYELASAIDDPVVLPDGRVESCGNFHGAPLGFAADFLAIAVSEIGAIAERRMDRMLDHTRSQGLPPVGRLLRLFPALRLLPGHTPAQELLNVSQVVRHATAVQISR